MDQNTMLEDILKLARALLADEPDKMDASAAHGAVSDGQRLAELVTGLDGWLLRGAAYPERWEQARRLTDGDHVRSGVRSGLSGVAHGEWKAWRLVCASLRAAGAVTDADLASSVTELKTAGQKLLQAIRTWGQRKVSMEMEAALKDR